MAITKEMFELRIKETCAELRHVQSQMNAIIVRSTENTFNDDTENSNLSQEMLVVMRHYQDALFSTLNYLRRKYDNYCTSIQGALDRMCKSSVERQRINESPKVPTGSAMIETPLGQELGRVGDCCPENPNGTFDR